MSDTQDVRSRSERHRRARTGRRVSTFAAIAAVLLVLAAGIAWGVRAFTESKQELPRTLVLIGESELEDGTIVAGLVAVVDSDASGIVVTGVDTRQEASLPGTSFDLLRDALPMGGADAVAEALGEDPDEAMWVVLTEEAWAALVDRAGGVEISLPESTTVFTGAELFRFEGGEMAATGAQARALAMGAESLTSTEGASALRVDLGTALGEAAVSFPDAVASALAGGQGDSSHTGDQVAEFLLGSGASR